MIPTSAQVTRFYVLRDYSAVVEYATYFEIVGDFAPDMINWIERDEAALKRNYAGLACVTAVLESTMVVRFRWRACANSAHRACTEAIVARILKVGANMESRFMTRQSMSRSGSDASTDTHGSY